MKGISMITTRRAKICDVENIMTVIKEAQKYLSEQNIDQWQDDFPNADVIAADISKDTGYVFENDGKIVGFFAFYDPPEPVYAHLEDGQWLNNTDSYGAIHRVAVSKECRGMGLGHRIYEECIDFAKERGYASIRVDTHPNNKIMRHTAESHGFKLCGVVYYPGKLKRIAFEKLL